MPALCADLVELVPAELMSAVLAELVFAVSVVSGPPFGYLVELVPAELVFAVYGPGERP
jgi:hypothetical protein